MARGMKTVQASDCFDKAVELLLITLIYYRWQDAQIKINNII